MRLLTQLDFLRPAVAIRPEGGVEKFFRAFVVHVVGRNCDFAGIVGLHDFIVLAPVPYANVASGRQLNQPLRKSGSRRGSTVPETHRTGNLRLGGHLHTEFADAADHGIQTIASVGAEMLVQSQRAEKFLRVFADGLYRSFFVVQR